MAWNLRLPISRCKDPPAQWDLKDRWVPLDQWDLPVRLEHQERSALAEPPEQTVPMEQTAQPALLDLKDLLALPGPPDLKDLKDLPEQQGQQVHLEPLARLALKAQPEGSRFLW